MKGSQRIPPNSANFNSSDYGHECPEDKLRQIKQPPIIVGLQQLYTLDETLYFLGTGIVLPYKFFSNVSSCNRNNFTKSD